MGSQFVKVMLAAVCLSVLGCGMGDESGSGPTTPGGTNELAGGNRWTLSAQTGEPDEGVVSSHASELQSNGIPTCATVGKISTSPLFPCCNSSRALGRREYRYYCCYGSDAYNAGSASLCCSGSKRSGNYCF